MAIYTIIATVALVGLIMLAVWSLPTCYTREYIDTHPDLIRGWTAAAAARIYDLRCPTTFSTVTSIAAIIPAAGLLYCIGHWGYYIGTYIERRFKKGTV